MCHVRWKGNHTQKVPEELVRPVVSLLLVLVDLCNVRQGAPLGSDWSFMFENAKSEVPSMTMTIADVIELHS